MGLRLHAISGALPAAFRLIFVGNQQAKPLYSKRLTLDVHNFGAILGDLIWPSHPGRFSLMHSWNVSPRRPLLLSFNPVPFRRPLGSTEVRAGILPSEDPATLNPLRMATATPEGSHGSFVRISIHLSCHDS